MNPDLQKLVIVGHGAAGLAAAVAAAEQARSLGSRADITLLEKSREDEAGGNTRWSPSYMRMAAPDRLAPEFEEDMRRASGVLADRGYFRTLANNAAVTIGWLQAHGVEFDTPVYYLSAGPPRIQPIGGGRAIVEKLSDAARKAGVKFLYESPVNRLVAKSDGVGGVEVGSSDGANTTLEADAVVLASGGFQGNVTMMRKHFGPAAETLKLISPGTRFDTGDGIRMAMELGAAVSGDWNGMHIEPIDPRSRQSAPVMLVYPYGIVVDQDGRRFFDEGGGLVHETWEAFARDIHFARSRHIAYAILDSRLYDISGFERAIRSDMPPYQAETIEALAALIDIPARNLTDTIETFNAAATGDAARFDATRCDGLAADSGLDPPKSNWARAITRPPFLAYPVVGAIAYTFGGLATNVKAEVLSERGPIPGLYAAGETTGHFYQTAPNAVSVLRSLVFGRIAGRQAIDFLQSRIRQARM
ncbi:FAD-binding protein [Bradyrhizobium canariense]|uniref:Tricarballylate dehydrogenase n=1 Tax=Bradyrhizobium canariense TaxID=255045 RepID=A0A1H1UF94_9BRAD|nr:FAD-binding protein [Bradyrhizobium canariense]SDS70941.1 tricarballylate dehydrogenase [Bradyrhizobium canariense]